MQNSQDLLDQLFDLQEKAEKDEIFNMTDGLFVRSCLKNSDEKIRNIAVELVPDIPGSDSELLKLLQGLVNDPEPNVRKAVYNSISNMEYEDERIPEILKKAVITETNAGVAAIAMEVYGYYVVSREPKEEAAPFLQWLEQAMQRNLLRNSELCQLIYHFILYEFDMPGSLRTVLSYLGSHDKSIRVVVCFMLKERGCPDDFSKVAAALKIKIRKEKDETVRSIMEDHIHFFEDYDW